MRTGIVNGIYTGVNDGIEQGLYTGINSGIEQGTFYENRYYLNNLDVPIVKNGLVLHYDAGNQYSYSGSGSGILWRNVSGNSYNGTLTNGPLFDSLNGGSIVFDGVNNFVETNFIPASNSSYSMGIWAKSSINTGNGNRPIGNADGISGLNGTCLVWGIFGTNLLLFVRRNGSNDGLRDISYTVPSFTTQIFYIVATYDTSVGSRLYVNGVQQGQNATLGYSSILTLKIGKDGSGTNAFNGNIYNVQFYSRAISAQEVQQNFNVTRARYRV